MKENDDKRKLSIYVHIPFCKSKCAYCDFLSFGGCGYGEQKNYFEALCREIDAYGQISADYVVDTIFIGGGTPSYVDASWIAMVLEHIRTVFDVDGNAEITIEGNPDSLKSDKLAAYHKLDINRLSIGLQSANDKVLASLNRVHNFDQFVAAYKSARQAGFYNINVDVMSGLPGESEESYIRTLGRVVDLAPEHISAYSLIVEDGTPLSENEELLSMMPTEEEDRALYAKTKMLLKNSGYERYEISNYSKKGYECRHNMGYWTGHEYLGVGLGASSYMKVYMEDGKCEFVRFSNVDEFDEYVRRFSNCDGMQENSYTEQYHFYEENDMEEELLYGYLNVGMESNKNVQYKEYEDNVFLSFIRDYYMGLQFLKKNDRMEEFMFLGLRMMKGVSVDDFKEQFGVAIREVYGKIIDKYVEKGLLKEEAGRIFLTDKGIDVSNVVMAEFML